MKIAKDQERFHSDFLQSQKELGKEFDPGKGKVEAERLRSFVLSGEYEVEQKSVGFNLGMMFRSLFEVADELSEFGFHILLAPNNSAVATCSPQMPETTAFVTSDNPVFTIRPEGNGIASAGMGFGWSGVEVYMPVGKRCCLRLARGLKPAHGWVSERFLRQINLQTMANASHFIYSSRGEKRLGRLFDEFGCKVKMGENAFIPPKAP
ncbi:MAG TPA: DUF4238 domain-containing protein [Candidatus Solibacter sp.]|nr:DUF4238 domain-containing protein [Candidatus Solibacter sp.]